MKKVSAEDLVAIVGCEAARALCVPYGGHTLPSLTELLGYERRLCAINDFFMHEPIPIIEMRYQVKRSTLMKWVSDYKKQHQKAEDTIGKVAVHKL